MAATSVHVISKTDNAKHAVFQVQEDLASSALAESSVRVRTSIVSLTSNNLTYALGGNTLRYWDAFPVPQSAPAPYNNSEEWGIVPAWGYGRVVESTIDSVAVGSLLWGVWQTSAHAVDLKLKALEPTGHWHECSEHRAQLMTAYNRYEQVAEQDPAAMKMAALCNPLWQASYVLNHAVFSSPPIHPLGFGMPWSEEDADLSSAVVISLSASSKTGRGLSWALARDRDLAKKGPLALLQLTSVPDSLVNFSDSSLPTKSARYDDPDPMTWVSSFKPSRIVMVDFGASDETMQSLAQAATKVTANVTTIIVGYEAKVYSSADLEARAAMTTLLNPQYLNTSGLRDRAIEAVGEREFFQQLDSAWEKYYKENGFGDLKMKTLKGVKGPDGLEGAWGDLCGRKVSPDTGLVIEL